jgi:hypothetical protein
MIQVFHISDVEFWREYLLKKIQNTDVIDGITEIKREMYKKEKISLIVTEEQNDTLFVWILYGWDVDGVNDT